MIFRHPAVLALLILLILGASVATLQSIRGGSSAAIPGSLPLAAVNGPQKTLVILVQFSDKPNSTRLSRISATLKEANDYYREDSYGIVSFQTDIAPASGLWYMMPSTMTYYGADSTSTDSQLIHDALQAAYNAGVNIGSYKFSIVVHAGDDEAMTHASSDIHSFTIPGYIFSPGLLTSYTISSSVVSENDPVGVFSHESGHLLGLPDLYDLTQRIDPVNNFVGYWEIMALGEWNPNTGSFGGPQPGTYPSHMSSWSKIQLGLVPASNIATVDSGNSLNVTIQNLETPTSGIQVVKIPIGFDQNGKPSYYLLEMRAKIGTFDQYLPFPSTYLGAGLLVYKVNESIANGMGSLRLVDAHPRGDLSDAPFGPCLAPCISNNTFWDQSNFVKVIVGKTTSTYYNVTVDRTSSPLLLLQVNTPASGILVSVDGANQTTDSSKQVRVPVHFGPHTVYVQPQIPVSIGSTTVSVGLTNSFSSWDTGGTLDPQGFSITKDTVVTAIYGIGAEPSTTLAIAAVVVLVVVAAAMTLHRRRKHTTDATSQPQLAMTPGPTASSSSGLSSLPRNNGLPRNSEQGDQETEGA